MLNCLGVTKDKTSGDFILVLEKMEPDLRTFIKRTKSTLTWNMVYEIFWEFLYKIDRLHLFNIVHRDMYSADLWYPANIDPIKKTTEPTTEVYGKMPYIAPEVIRGGECTR